MAIMARTIASPKTSYFETFRNHIFPEFFFIYPGNNRPIRTDMGLKISGLAGLTVAQTKQYDDKLVNIRSQRAPITSTKPDMKSELARAAEGDEQGRRPLAHHHNLHGHPSHSSPQV